MEQLLEQFKERLIELNDYWFDLKSLKSTENFIDLL